MSQTQPKTNERIRVALLIGGDSAERSVSFMSGKAVAEALSPERFDVTIFDVSSEATRRQEPSGAEMLGTRARHALRGVEWNQLITTLYTSGFDVALPELHSGRGEDGTLQALLEVAGIAYVGSPMRASVLAMDKAACKALLRDYGIPSPRGVVVEDANQQDEIFSRPCVIKPNASGSSVGVKIFKTAPTRQQLQAAIGAALQDGPAMVEELVEGVEITAATIGEGRSARALPLIEIVPQSAGGFYDFEAKYAVGGSQHLIPPRLSQEAQDKASDYALRAHRALGCRGVARSDFIVTPDGTPLFLEINTLPGMTATSLVPDAARAAGIEFGALLESLIDEALSLSRK